MSIQFCTEIVGEPKRTFFRRKSIVRPVTMIDVLNPTKKTEGDTRRQLHTRMWRPRLFMLLLFFIALMLPVNPILALPISDMISYRDFTFPSHLEPFFIDVNTYSLNYAPWPQSLREKSTPSEYVQRADLERANRRAVATLKNVVSKAGKRSVLLGEAAGGKIRIVFDDEADDFRSEDELDEGAKDVEKMK